MLNVVCVKWGTKYGPEYVNILFDMVRRNLPEGFPGRFVCFTDDATGINESITTRGLPPGIEGWWNKLVLFRSSQFEHGDRILYLDLDTVVTGKLDDIATYDGPFAICRDFYRDNGLQSCVMAWEAGGFTGIWTEWNMHRQPKLEGGDQEWIERYFSRHGYAPDLWQDLYAGQVVSFKRDCQYSPPERAVLVNFHGDPKPHECADEWVALTWKIGGGSSKELREVCNVQTERIASNVRSAAARALPWLDAAPAHDGHAVLVGGAPSLHDCVRELHYRYDLGQTFFALNGSIGFLTSHGILPNAQVIVDARPENIGFVQQCVGQHFFLASQCDPSLFDALDGENVTVAHLNTPDIVDHLMPNSDDKPIHLVGGGSTVLLNAMVMAYVLGFRKMHLYGVDSCYQGDRHHAFPQPQNDGERVLDVVFGNTRYRAAPWMIGQVDQFQKTAVELANMGCTITVAGTGLLPDVARDLERNGPPVNAADQRCQAILSRLPDNGPLSGVELGVFTGALSMRLLANRPSLTLYMVDSWEGGGAAYADGTNDFHAKLNERQQNAYHAGAQQAVSFAGTRAHIIRKRTEDAALEFAPRSMDFVFIDADHSYQGAKRDIERWRHKVKHGGLLCGHDYAHPEFPGVKLAVDEFAAEHGYKIDCGENFTWFVRA